MRNVAHTREVVKRVTRLSSAHPSEQRYSMDLVVIDYVFTDDTAWTNPAPMPRWVAEWELWRMVTFDLQPVPGGCENWRPGPT